MKKKKLEIFLQKKTENNKTLSKKKQQKTEIK